MFRRVLARRRAELLARIKTHLRLRTHPLTAPHARGSAAARADLDSVAPDAVCGTITAANLIIGSIAADAVGASPSSALNTSALDTDAFSMVLNVPTSEPSSAAAMVPEESWAARAKGSASGTGQGDQQGECVCGCVCVRWEGVRARVRVVGGGCVRARMHARARRGDAACLPASLPIGPSIRTYPLIGDLVCRRGRVVRIRAPPLGHRPNHLSTVLDGRGR